MTRVNILNPELLTDQHLIAERLELTFVVSSARRAKNIGTIPKYTLGKGHVAFFHDKLEYIFNRFLNLTIEMKKRSMKPKMPFPNTNWCLDERWNNWVPTEEDFYVIKARIRERLLMKPHWYKYYKNPIDKHWIDERY